MRGAIEFLHAGERVTLKDVKPTETLLDYLRIKRRMSGTKEGCAEGDCGACTVALGRLVDGRIIYRPVNACIQLLGMVDGAQLVSVENLEQDGRLHPVQSAMVESHGSQCGFCTPGIVMNLFTLYHEAGDEPVSRRTITDWLSGNLCRCTGYRPIIDAASAACAGPLADEFSRNSAEFAAELQDMASGEDLLIGSPERFFAAPASVNTLASLYAKHPDATLIAGATDVGLWITKKLQDLPQVIWLGRVKELQRIEETSGGVLFGAGATYSDLEPAMNRVHPDLGLLWRRIGSKQVRASGTVGGNIANGSPIGDTPPALIALGATLELRRGEQSRTMPLEDFFIDYGVQDRMNGEFVTGIFTPRLESNQIFSCFKVSKRFDQDISSVMGAFRLTVMNDTITEARFAFGGMASTPRRAVLAETAIIGARLKDPTSWSAAMRAITEDFAPLSDMRASAGYRREIARALLAKALMEASGASKSRTRLQSYVVEQVTQNDVQAQGDAPGEGGGDDGTF